MDLLFKLYYELSTDQGSRDAAGEVPGTGTLGTPGPRPSPPPASCPALSQAVTRATTCWGGAGAGAGSWLPRPLYTSPMAAMRLVVNSGDWAGSECRWVWRLQDTCGETSDSCGTEQMSGVVLQTINPRSCTISEEAPTRAFSWLKAATTAFTFKTLLRHYARRALTPRSLNLKLGPRRKYHKGRAVWLA